MLFGSTVGFPISDASPVIALHNHLAVFLAGMLVAVCSTTDGTRTTAASPAAARGGKYLWDLVAALALAAILAPWLLGAPFGASHRFVRSVFGGGEPWFGFAWAFFLFAVLHGRGPVRWILESRVLRITGVVSFSAYLWHMAILSTLRRPLMAAVDPPVAAAMILALVLCASIVSYLLVEKPCMTLAARWSRRLAG